MGYDVNLRLEVTPKEHFAAVQFAIREQFGKQFDENGDGEIHGSDWCYDTRWSNLTEDMLALSKGFPDLRISILGEGHDGYKWIEFFHDGKYRTEGQPEWDEPAWDDAKMGTFPYKPVEGPKKFTVILAYPDYIPNDGGHPTWMGHVHGKDKSEAVLNARTEVMAGLDEAVDPEDLYTIAVIAGHHEDLNV